MKKTNEKMLFQGQWLALWEEEFLNEQGEVVFWESVRRKQSGTALVVIAKLMPSERFVLIRQFRPAIQGYVLGFPAGVCFDGDLEGQAICELKEETGYVGRVEEMSPPLMSNSALINDGSRLVKMIVDEEAPENTVPRQELEPSEEIEVVLLKKENAHAFFEEERAKGTHIGGGLWYVFGIRDFVQ